VLTNLGKSVVRITSFTGKELREVVRRPGVLLSLILGPFLVMLIFGIGYTGARKPFPAEIVVPPESGLSTEAAYYQEVAGPRVDIVRVSDDAEAAEDRLREQEIAVLIVAPESPAQDLRAGEQSLVRVLWNEVDPVNHGLAQLAAQELVSQLNREIIRRAAEAGLNMAESELGPAVEGISPDIIAEPTRAETENVAATEPNVLAFFGPAVFALVLQHLAITLTALSLVRERLSGQLDLFRVSPVNSMEVLVGKYLAFAVFSLAISAVIAVLLVTVLGVPMLGGWQPFVGVMLLLIFASLGVGLLISLTADSERMAVQLSMIVLLASVFFSGFVLPVEDFIDQVQLVSYALPVTHGIAALQATMLRGEIREVSSLGMLAGIGLLLYVASLLRLRRIMRSAD
jgi:ABC-2 type transport system permease protein